MTFRAMAERVDEIGAAIPLRRLRRIGTILPAAREQPFPDSDIASDVERKRQIVVGRFSDTGASVFR